MVTIQKYGIIETSAIKEVPMKITDDSITNGSYHVPTTKSRWAKINGTQKSILVSPWRMYCIYSGMAKGTSWAKVMSNSKKIKPVALAIVELCESEGISQSSSYLFI